MDARLRLTFFCGTCLGLAVGFAGGHLALWRTVAPSQRSSGEMREGPSALRGVPPFDLSGSTPLWSGDAAHTPSPGGGRVLNDPDLGDEPVHADALVEFPALAADLSQLNLPQRLPLPSAKYLHPASPLKPRFARTASSTDESTTSEAGPPLDPEVLKMLKDELQGVSEQQREVWADALQGMSPSDAAGVILM